MNSQITMRNQEVSPLLRLPPELRNKVYQYVIGGNTYIIPFYWNKNTGRYSDDFWGQYPSRSLTLLRVCRQIYTETALLPYSLNSFSACQLRELLTLLDRRTASQVTALRRLEVVTVECRQMFEDNFELNTHEFQFLGRLEGLEGINVVQDEYWEDAPELNDENMRRLARMIRAHKPNVKITAQWGREAAQAIDY